MEPANRTPPPDHGDDRLEALLRAPASALPDDGFSARVLAALPPPDRASHVARASVAQWCGFLAALATLAALTAAAPWMELQTAFAPVSVSFTDPGVLAALVVALGSTVYALWPALRKRLA
ncbi:MAG: hypothetical protein NTV51_17860 [Verrucomicrobia bacterium]|nr:hypothetical protein [Verrucomicrobiota bacterium]